MRTQSLPAIVRQRAGRTETLTMVVYALMPVFNRLALTRQAVESLRQQRGVALRIVIIDDGSTDGTGDYLAAQRDVSALKGDGSLWWGGAMNLGLRHILPLLREGDYFLFVNNDTSFSPDFVASLVAASQAHGRSAVGSIVRDADDPSRVLTIGARANLAKFQIHDIAADYDLGSLTDPGAHRDEVLPVDFLPGRGTLYPGEVLERVGTMRPRLLPHYRADYEFSDRVRRAGVRLIVSLGSALLTHDAFGTEKKIPSLWQRNFGKGSPDNRIQTYIFFSLTGNASQRVSAVPRLLWHVGGPHLRHGASVLKRHANRVGRGVRRLIGLSSRPG